MEQLGDVKVLMKVLACRLTTRVILFAENWIRAPEHPRGCVRLERKLTGEFSSIRANLLQIQYRPLQLCKIQSPEGKGT
jgi:hypothetical protein